MGIQFLLDKSTANNEYKEKLRKRQKLDTPAKKQEEYLFGIGYGVFHNFRNTLLAVIKGAGVANERISHQDHLISVMLFRGESNWRKSRIELVPGFYAYPVDEKHEETLEFFMHHSDHDGFFCYEQVELLMDLFKYYKSDFVNYCTDPDLVEIYKDFLKAFRRVLKYPGAKMLFS